MEIKDLSLEDYIGVSGKCATYLPHTAGRYQKKRFRKAQVRLVFQERGSFIASFGAAAVAAGCCRWWLVDRWMRVVV